MLRVLYLIYSKFWLNILLDDCQFGYITKLKKKKPCVSCLGNSQIRALFWATHIPNIFLPAQGQYKNPIKDWWPWLEPSKRRQKLFKTGPKIKTTQKKKKKAVTKNVLKFSPKFGKTINVKNREFATKN